LKIVDSEAYPQEILADEEPKYLRRQKPLEIKRRKFGRKAWKSYLYATGWAAAGLAGIWFAYECGSFLLNSRQMALVHPEQVVISGNHYVPRIGVLEIFAADRNQSVLRIPLQERRRQIESVPWVEQAVVRRALPNTIQVELVERTPIAFLREGSDMGLIDVHGVILKRPLEGNFHFPVITGITADMPADDRAKRMQLFAAFTQQLATARAGALDQVSEVDLSDAGDLRATLTGLQGLPVSEDVPAPNGSSSGWGQVDAPVRVHFGDGDFEAKYQTLIENIGTWRATTGRVASVDLRFNGQAVVNPEKPPVAQLVAKHAAAEHHSR
jgi:cell division protein FtsQ